MISPATRKTRAVPTLGHRHLLLSPPLLSLVAFTLIGGLLAVSFYGLLEQDLYLCLETLFLAFIPYLIWSSYSRVKTLDIFAPDLGFPLAYILYLFCGSISLPVQTQFGLALPWTVWLYYIIGLVSYLAGVRLIFAPPAWIAAHGIKKRFWHTGRYLTAAVGLLLLGAAARLVIILQSGLEIFHTNNEAARVAGAKGIFAVFSLCLDPAFLCILLFLIVKKPGGLLRWMLMGAMILVILNAIATSNRTPLLRVSLAAVVMAHYAWKRFSFAKILVFGVLATAFASALGTFRDVSEWGDQHIRELESQGFTSQTFWLMNGYEAVRLPTEVFEMTVEDFPAVDPYTFGRTSLAEFGAFLPGPTLAPSEIIKNKLRFQFVGFGAAGTILAPLWADGGVIGIIVGMFVIGVGSRLLHQRVLFSSNYIWILVYAWFLQNAFKALKDDIIPDISLLFVLAIFPCLQLFCMAQETEEQSTPPRSAQARFPSRAG